MSDLRNLILKRYLFCKNSGAFSFNILEIHINKLFQIWGKSCMFRCMPICRYVNIGIQLFGFHFFLEKPCGTFLISLRILCCIVQQTQFCYPLTEKNFIRVHRYQVNSEHNIFLIAHVLCNFHLFILVLARERLSLNIHTTFSCLHYKLR